MAPDDGVMMRSINVAIPDEAAAKLRELADREFRAPRQQAAILILDGLKRADLEARERAALNAAGKAER